MSQLRERVTGVPGLARMRVEGFVRSGRALAPLLATMVVLAVGFGGGAAPAGEAYGYIAAVLFPVLALHTLMLLNTESDGQRRLSQVAVGGLRREITSGLLAAGVTALVLVVLALVVPWPIGGITGPHKPGDPTLVSGIVAGTWAILLLLPPAMALGAVASRAAVGTAARGLTVLAAGSVIGYVAGVRDSVVWWLGPPLLTTSRSTVNGLDVTAMVGHTVHALVWGAVVGAIYVVLRRRNS